MIRLCSCSDFEVIYKIINDAAQAYKGVIPADCWKEPYMSKDELRHELTDGVVLWGYEEDEKLIGVMGIQRKQNVILIRHAYVYSDRQNHGIGGKLLSHLLELAKGPTLIATWSNADWAIRFYEKHGFRLVHSEEIYRLQRKYWSTPELKIKASIVLADEKWFRLQTNIP